MGSLLGQEGYNKFGSKMIITRDEGYKNVDIYFPEYDWTFENTRRDYFTGKTAGCPYEPRLHGVGYLGEGNYPTRENGKMNKCYHTWQGMLGRCYDKKYQENKPTYKGCIVCDEWLCYQNFAKWYYENIYFIEGQQMHLDKDILNKGNKIYSPETCVFVPERINSLFTKNDNVRGKYPIGITIDNKTKHFRARCSTLDDNGKVKRVELGSYLTIEEAFNAYKTFKEKYIKQVADEYRELIPEKLYLAMYNWEVDIND